MTGPVAKRYARALFALAVEEGDDVETCGAELARVSATFAEPQLASFARSASVDVRTKRAVVGKIVERLGVSKRLANFAGLLAKNNRLAALPAIEARYCELVDRRVGRVRARVRSARPLDGPSQQKIQDAFERKTGKKVLAELTIEPELIGGVIVEVEGRVYDGSVRTQLEGMTEALSG